MLPEARSSEMALECSFTCINIMFLDDGIRQNFSISVHSLKCDLFGVLDFDRDSE